MRVGQKETKRAGLLEEQKVDSMEMRSGEKKGIQMAEKWVLMMVVWKEKRRVESKAG